MSTQDNVFDEILDINDSRCTMDMEAAVKLLMPVFKNRKIALQFLSQLVRENKIYFKVGTVIIDKYTNNSISGDDNTMIRTEYNKDESRSAFYDVFGRMHSVTISNIFDQYVMSINYVNEGDPWFVTHVANPMLDPDEIKEYTSDGSVQTPIDTAYPDLGGQFLRPRRPGPKPKYWTHMAWAELARRAVQNDLKDDNGDRLSQTRVRQQLLQWVHDSGGDIGDETARQIVEHLWTALSWR